MLKKILHTSDWHIGKKLKERERYDEFKKFFEWLEKLIRDEEVEALLVPGDIFDTSTPSTSAQDIYYSFLSRLAGTACRHVVITSGNHDSPAFLDAPADLLKLCKINVIGAASSDPSDEVIILKDQAGTPEAIICAVPYLRDRDVRTLSAGENISSLEENLTAGIKNHYEKVFELAKNLQGDSDIPVIAMGHMFLKGGRTHEGDGVRSLYVGTSIQVKSDIFPEELLTYTALGHLHSPQAVGRENIFYSGSPLVMDFGELKHEKAVCLLELEQKNLTGLKKIPVPSFQRLERVAGSMKEILEQLEILAAERESIWLDVVHRGNEVAGNLQEQVNEAVKFTPLLEVLSVRDETPRAGFERSELPKGIENIKPLEMLEIFFKEKNVPEDQKEKLKELYTEIFHEVAVL